MNIPENSDPVGERLSGFIQAISAMPHPPVPLLRFREHLAMLLRVRQGGEAPTTEHMRRLEELGGPSAEEEELCRHTLAFLGSAPEWDQVSIVLKGIMEEIAARRHGDACAPAAARPVYVSEEIDVYYDDAAKERLQKTNDLRYLSADGIVQVDKERWRAAQRYEKKTWMERSLEDRDDRNFEHEERFDRYEAVAGRSFENIIELGCGPFTNLRLILPHLKSAGSVTLLDPLIDDYLRHPHCTYKDGTLAAHAVQTIASSIEEFDPPPGSYDLVVMNNVLEHCFNIPKIFHAIAAMMRTGGTLVFADVAFSASEVRRMAETRYDAGHPIRLSEELLRRFLAGRFRTLYERTFEGLYEQPYRKDIYFIGERADSSPSVSLQAEAGVSQEEGPRQRVIHFVYAGDPRDDRAISAPGTITNRLFRLFERHMPVRYYDIEDETTPVEVGTNDIIIGHPHPRPNTALRRLFARPAAAKLLLWPFHSALPEINRYACDLAEEADRLLMISGPYWTERIGGTEFARWKDKVVRLDNAVDPAFFALRKTRFNAPGNRGLFVLGRSGVEKGTRRLFELLSKTDCRVIVAGEYEEEDLKIIRGRKNIYHMGRLSWSDTQAVGMIMSECDFFINLSVSDASPTTLFETMASGLIPVTTPQCGYHYPSFILLTGSDPLIDLNILQHAQSLSEEYLTQLQQANRRLIEERHNWESLTKDVWAAVAASISAQPQEQPKRAKKMLVAGEAAQEMDLTKIDDHSAFAREITAVFKKSRPKKIIETGTYLGTGTTAIIAGALKDLQLAADAEFYSIEIDPGHHAQASRNLREAGLLDAVTLLNGVSVPRGLLPSYDEIERSTVGREEDEQIYVDHQEHERARLYFEETDFQKVPDDLLGACLKTFAYTPDFVLLDSAGHMGFIEFTYLISQLRGDCYIALDDIWHIKHYRSFRAMQQDPRFEILVSSKEKFGFCLARFTYDPALAASTAAAVGMPAPQRNLVWIRSDAIGDAILASSMLRPLKEAFPGYALTVVCQTAVRGLYEACPYVDNIISFDLRKLWLDKAYQQQVAGEVRALNAEKAFNSVFSRDLISDYLATNSGARERFAHEGDLSNITPEQRAANDRYYTRIIKAEPSPRTELERHRDFLAGVGIEHAEPEPVMWLTAEDRAYARELFASHGLSGERTIALFAGAQHDVRLYGDYGKALETFCARHGYEVIVLGSAKDRAINTVNIRDLRSCLRADLTGTTTLRQSAAILEKCAAAVGAETGLAHMACAVGTPNLILVGGGHFGRFMPYSPLTTVVALPLDCFGCNWQCKYGTTTCVKDVDHRVILEALEAMFAKTSGTRLLCLQTSYRYDFLSAFPKCAGVDHLLQGGYEVLTIDPFAAAPSHSAPALENVSERIHDEAARQAIVSLHELFRQNGRELAPYAALEKKVMAHADTLRPVLAEAMASGAGEDAFFQYAMGLCAEGAGEEETSYDWYLRSLKHQRNLRALFRLAEISVKLALPTYPIFLYQELLALGVASEEVKKHSKMVIDLLAVKNLQKLTPVAPSLVMPPTLPPPGRKEEDSGASPLVSFVLPTRNRLEGLTAFLESLEAACWGVPYEVLLYRGDGADDAYRALAARHPITHLYADGEIFGKGEKFSWTKLMNHGFRHAQGGWIMYASDDIVLHPLAVTFGLRCAEGAKAAGGVSFMHRNTIQDYDGYFRDYGCDRYGERPFINFGLISKSAFMKVKGFDEQLTFYAGDTDLCWRIVDAGYEILPSYYSLVEHINIEDMTKVSNSGATYRRDMQAFYKKWLPAIGRLKDRVIVRERFTLTDARRVKRHICEMAAIRGLSFEKIGAFDTEYTALSAAALEPKKREIRVSAVVSAYNSERFMRGCLEDLTGQTLFAAGELEIIVIDSGSEEDEARIVQEYQQRHPNIVYERTARETIYAAWNRGIRRARGRFITNANADDRHAPCALEIMADILEKEEGVGVVYADVYQTSVPNDTFGSKTVKTPVRWMDFDADLLLFGCYIGPQPMWRRSLHEQHGYFDPSLKVVGDYEFWLRLSGSVLFHHHRETLGLYYLSPHSAEHRDMELTRREDDAVRRMYLMRYCSCADDVNRIEAKLETLGRSKELEDYCRNARTLLRLRRQALETGGEIKEVIAEAEALIEEGETARARRILEAVLAAHPEHIDALNDLSVLEIMEKKWLEAARLIHKVIGLEPENESARQNLRYLAQATAPVGSN